MFNVEDETDDGNEEERLTRIFLNMFNKFRGYNSNDIPLAILLEKQLDKKGIFEQFKTKVKEVTGFDWETDAADAAAFQLNDILDIAKELEGVALKDQYFIDRGLYPNVDFYSGIIYRALGIPTDMFTVMFALGRLPGWVAQWKEMRENGDPIGRPRQVYTGHNDRPYIPINER